MGWNHHSLKLKLWFGFGLMFLSFTRAESDFNTTEPLIQFPVKGFNYEFASRTQSQVETFLDSGMLPARQVRYAFKFGLVSANNTEEVRKFLFPVLMSDPQLGGLVVNLASGNITSLGYLRRSNVITYFTNRQGLCTNFTIKNLTRPLSETRCMKTYSIDEKGNPVGVIQRMQVYPRSFLGVPTEGTWQRISATREMLDSGMMYVMPLTNTSTKFVGTVASIVFTFNVDEYLLTNFANNSDGRIVFISNESAELLGASVEGVAYTRNQQGVTVPVLGVNCSNALIRKASALVTYVPHSSHSNRTILVSADLMIQQPVILRPGLHWHIISVREGHPEHDYPNTHSVTFAIVTGLCGVLFGAMLMLGVLIVRHRKQTRLWRYAHPQWLLAMLAANLLCLAYASANMATPTDVSCEVVSWLRVVALTTAVASVLAKVEVMHHAAKTFDESLSRNIKTRLLCIFVVCAIQMVVLALQNRGAHLFFSTDTKPQGSGYVPPNVNVLRWYVDTSFAESDGTLVERKMCKHVHAFVFRVFNDAVICVLSVVVMYRSVRSRNASVFCEESRGMLVAGLEVAIACVAIVGIKWERRDTSDTAASQAWLVSGLMLWYVGTMMLFVFGPRVYRHVAIGDLTITEMRDMLKHAVKAHQSTSVHQPIPVTTTPGPKGRRSFSSGGTGAPANSNLKWSPSTAAHFESPYQSGFAGDRRSLSGRANPIVVPVTDFSYL